jgi:hypothetical protein
MSVHNGKRHPKTDAIVLSYLQGMGHKEVSRTHDVAYNTCVTIGRRYVKWVPVLKRPTKTLDSTRTVEYERLL